MRCLGLLLVLFGGALLRAQERPEALDILPRGAAAYLFLRSPLLAQAKLSGLLQRFGQDPATDPLTALQARFGLKRLPTDRRGLALVMDAADVSATEPQPLLFLAIGEPGPLVEALRAKPGEKGLYAFSAGGGSRVMAFRSGWAVLGDRSQAPAVRRAAQGPGGLRAEVGELAPWLEARDGAALLTPEGMGAILHQFRQDAAAGRAQARGGAPDPLAQVEPVLARIQREVRFLGATVDLDEHGNLTGVLRAQLHPQGQWALMGEGLDLRSAPGLGDLRGSGFMVAMAGALPEAWSRAALEFQMSLAGAAPGAPAVEGPREQAMGRLLALVKGSRVLIPEGQPLPLQVLEVKDGEAYLREMEAFLTLPPASPALPKGVVFPTLRTERRRVDDHEALVVLPPRTQVADLPPEIAAELADRPTQVFLMRDPHTIEVRTGGHAYEGPTDLIADLPALRTAADLLPKTAHLYAFFNPRAFALMDTHALAAAEARLDEAQRAALPAVPDLPPFPGMGLALRLDPGVWELHVALPWELQVGLGLRMPARRKAQETRKAAVEAALAQLPPSKDDDEEGDPED